MSVSRKLAAASACLLTASFAFAQAPAPSPVQGLTDTPVAAANTEAMRLAGIAKDDSREFGSDPDDPGPIAKDLSPALKTAAIDKAIRKVADWQLAQTGQYFTAIDRAKQLDGRIWTWSVLYTGYSAAADTLHEPRYRDAMEKVGEAYKWGLRTPTTPNGDDMSIAQMYLELYMKDKRPEQLAPIKTALDNVLAAPRIELGTSQRIAWWWCDALYMAPPTWARLYAVTGDRKYIAYLDEEFAKTTQLLYDPAAHLYSRDASFIAKTEPNGQKMFWSRGEGWVMGGLARTLEFLPKDDPARAKYENQLREMSAALAKIQNKDGLWSTSLLDPSAFNNQPEISGSALITFGMAWGINNGVLDRKTYTPVVRRAWAGMLNHIYADGRLGDIQQTGAQPSAFKPSASYNYGVGGFLLAGTELHKMSEGKSAKK
jgi:unsaturated rhamnogalacturonyl hydrolase